jgi:hypothetical protein
MKKLITLLFLVALTLSVSAQRSGSTTAFAQAEYYKNLTMIAADTVESTSYWIFALNKPKVQYFSFAVKCDTATLTSPSHIWFDVKGSVDGVTWVNTTATTVKFGGSVDSTFSLSDVSTGVLWRYLKLQAVNVNPERRAHRVANIGVKIGDK